ISGHTDSAVVKTLIRDHSKEKFEEKKNFLVEYTEFLNKKYGEKTVQVAITDNYYNMKEIIDVYPETVKIALKAMEKAGLNPKVTPIRGGTDGARLSFMGVPTPNLFTGGHNAHSIFEYVPIQSMRKATEVILNIVKEFARFEDYEK
ncbi:MAG: M20/M25/M40 family metallo-hydrolase, partial [Nitrospiraceae bacterium]|nr:M20/M25/M40 family metallo-hydrolase [Nitrospiraceae bacterium]